MRDDRGRDDTPAPARPPPTTDLSADAVLATARLSTAADEDAVRDGVQDLARVLLGGRPAGLAADETAARAQGGEVVVAPLEPGGPDPRVVWVGLDAAPVAPGAGGPPERDRVRAIAAAAAAASRHLTADRRAARRERWLEASAEITAALVGRTDEQSALQLVADRAREVGHARATWIVAGPDADRLEFRVVSGARLDLDHLRTLPMQDSVSADVVRSGVPLRLEDLGEDDRVARYHALPGSVRLGPAIVVPLPTSSGVAGVLGLGWDVADRDVFERLDSDLPAGFAEQVSLALTVSRMHRDARHLAVLRDRDRIGRDLHDLVIQRLFAIGLSLSALDRLTPEERTRRLESAVEQIDEAIGDLRHAIHSLGSAGPQADVTRQVHDVLDRVAPALGFPPVLHLSGPVRTATPAHVVPDLVAVLSEALSNIVRHARAASVRVVIALGAGSLELCVSDDGRGRARSTRRSGLENMARRAERLGGTLVLDETPGGGTRLTWSVPVE